jgi:L-fucose isomerase
VPAKRLPDTQAHVAKAPTIGVWATSDPRIDEEARARCVNIIEMAAGIIADRVKLPCGTPVNVVWSPILVDGEKQADMVARQFQAEGVDILVCVPDTWAFPQLGIISLLAQFPKDTPLNITCGNSGPRPGVVFAHAASGAISQYGKLVHLNVGTWPDTGQNPQMTQSTADALVDWCYAAVTKVALKGRRVVIFGHDSMGMETALMHVIATRNLLGLEITRLDMKLLADMVNKQAYCATELADLRGWIDKMCPGRVELRDSADSERFNKSLAMYLIARDLMKDLNAVGGGFMSQLEWGSDRRGIPLPVADAMESLFNSTFDHNGPKAPLAFATEADVQGLLTMLYFTWLSGGNPPLFMDFRKVWEPWEINRKADEIGLGSTDPGALWREKGLVDGDNSGSAAFDWAAKPGATVEQIMAGVSFPLADEFYFPGGGNSVTFFSPGGIEGIAARMAYSAESNCFSLVWDEACTVDLPEKLAQAVANTSTPTWPHTWVVPKYATMGEYKQFAPANHFHMTWGLKPSVLQYWMDLANVLSIAPWQARPSYIEGTDRPTPLLYLLNGGESATKLRLAGR